MGEKGLPVNYTVREETSETHSRVTQVKREYKPKDTGIKEHTRDQVLSYWCTLLIRLTAREKKKQRG